MEESETKVKKLIAKTSFDCNEALGQTDVRKGEEVEVISGGGKDKWTTVKRKDGNTGMVPTKLLGD